MFSTSPDILRFKPLPERRLNRSRFEAAEYGDINDGNGDINNGNGDINGDDDDTNAGNSDESSVPGDRRGESRSRSPASLLPGRCTGNLLSGINQSTSFETKLNITTPCRRCKDFLALLQPAYLTESPG